MPFGLISHNLRFFASDNASHLEAQPDYKSWYQSMYTLFGNKWAAMHNGPMWSYIDTTVEEVESEPSADQSSDILTQAHHMGDGDLQQRHEEYIKCLQFVRGIGVKQRRAYVVIKADLEEQLRNMTDQKEFLAAGLAKARDCYKGKRKLLNVSEVLSLP